ncbi:hypothetical protein [Mycolicibacterium rhodesiae]|uniref:hypothetical protein n=1 Tax=Mycolicibacterium rhodesiae TaxID=36814 RepID=UPI001F2718B4|nr:hypothetical protein [Mycolicibacterium rhodesiae]
MAAVVVVLVRAILSWHVEFVIGMRRNRYVVRCPAAVIHVVMASVACLGGTPGAGGVVPGGVGGHLVILGAVAAMSYQRG